MNANEKYSTKTYKLSWLYSEIRELDIIPWSEFFFGLSPLFQFDFITNFTMYRTVGCFCFKLSIQFNSIRSLFQFLILFFVGNTLLFSLLWIYNTFHLFFFCLFLLSKSVLFCWFVWSKYQCNENSHMINGVLSFDVFASQLICFQFNLKCWVLLIILEMSRKDIRNNDDEHIFELWTGKRAILSPLMCRHSGGFVWNFFGGVTENVVTHVNHTYDLWWYGTWTIKSFAEIKYDLYQFTCMWMRTSRKIPLW